MESLVLVCWLLPSIPPPELPLCSLVRIGGGARRYCLPHRPRYPLYLFASVTQTIHNIHILSTVPCRVSLTELLWLAFTAHCYITMLYCIDIFITKPTLSSASPKGLGIFFTASELPFLESHTSRLCDPAGLTSTP